MTTFLNQLFGASPLNPAISEEVEGDRAATMQAMSVVALLSLAAGIGAMGLASARFTALAGISARRRSCSPSPRRRCRWTDTVRLEPDTTH